MRAEKLADFHVTPEKREALTDQAWGRVVAAKIVAMTPDARLLVRRAAAFRLRVGVDAIPHGTRLRRGQHQAAGDNAAK